MANSRRDIIKKTIQLGTIATVATAPTLNAFGQACNEATPAQTEGPYYPVGQREDENNDLTKVNGKTGEAKGQRLFLTGKIVEEGSCKPISGAIIEIWQCDSNGRYDHPGDRGQGQPLDPNFQYWGEAATSEEGEYSFKTIKPGLYPGRTRHIHFKVQLRGYFEFTSQLYFAGEPQNRTDGIYRNLGTRGQSLVTVDFQEENGELKGEFNITLRSVPTYT